MEAEEATNELRGLVGGGGRQMEAREATNESPGLVGGGGGQMEAGCRADGGRGNRPTSHRDSLVVVGGRWRPGVGQMEAEEATNESQGLVGGGGAQMEAGGRADGGRGNRPTSCEDSLVVV